MLRNEESVVIYGSGMLPNECVVNVLQMCRKEILYLAKFAHMNDVPSVVRTVGMIDDALKLLKDM